MIGWTLAACVLPADPAPRWRVVSSGTGARSDELEQVAVALEVALGAFGPTRSQFGDAVVVVEVGAEEPAAVRDALDLAALPSWAGPAELHRGPIGPPVFVVVPDGAERVRALERLPTTGVSRCGSGEEQWVVTIDPARATARGVGLGEVERAVRSATTADSLAELQLTADLSLRDVAAVDRSRATPDCRAVGPSGPVEVVELGAPLDGWAGLEAEIAALGVRSPAGAGIEFRHDPADAGVAEAVARATAAVVLDRRDGTARVLTGSPEAFGALAATRAAPGVTGAWDVAQPRVRVVGPEWDALDRLADAVQAALGAAGIRADRVDPVRRTVDVAVDGDRAAQFGLPAPEVARTVAAVAGGLPVGRVTDGAGERSVVVRIDNRPLDADQLHGVSLPTRLGPIPLAQVVTIDVGTERVRTRIDRQRVVELVVEGPVDAALAAAAAVALPPGYRVEGP